MFDENYSTFVSQSTSLDMKTLQEAIDLVFPVLYYATDSYVAEKGRFFLIKEGDFNPEYIVCHPDDLETLKQSINWRRFVHVNDEPQEKRLERIKKHYEKEMSSWKMSSLAYPRRLFYTITFS